MKAIVIGIMPQDKIRERVLSIARGEHKPKSSEPKIWFTSMRSLAEVLSDENRALLQVIKETNPQSITSLAETTGRKPGGYRVYYAQVGNRIILLTSGGDKKSQSRDIDRAVGFLKDWEKRNG